jgi:hypothetical protein
LFACLPVPCLPLSPRPVQPPPPGPVFQRSPEVRGRERDAAVLDFVRQPAGLQPGQVVRRVRIRSVTMGVQRRDGQGASAKSQVADHELSGTRGLGFDRQDAAGRHWHRIPGPMCRQPPVIVLSDFPLRRDAGSLIFCNRFAVHLSSPTVFAAFADSHRQ